MYPNIYHKDGNWEDNNNMHLRCFVPTFFILIALVFMPARTACGEKLTENAPNEHTPPQLVKAWLRFHEGELCQNVDAVFFFDNRGMEVRYVSKDDGIYQKLRELFPSPDGSYRVELYPTRKPPEKRASDDEGPPPSIYMNDELRRHLLDGPYAILTNEAEAKRVSEYRKWAVDTRLIAYAEQILEWNRKVNRYAIDLPLLIRVASDPSTASGTRSMAAAICKSHAQNMGKDLAKLEKNLKQAFPQGDKIRRSSKAEQPGKAEKTPAESAEQISKAAQELVRHIHRFIYPDQHTVTLEELRQPSILENLGSLERMVWDFQKALPSLPSGKAPVAHK
jgi:hypothetical protein